MKMLLRAGCVVLLSATFLACSNSKQNKGDAYFNKGKYEEAVGEYSETLKFNPNDVTSLYNRGRAFEEQGQYDSALNDFEKAMQIDPNNFQILLSIANIHYLNKEYSKSLLFANRAEEISGAPAAASFMKGRALHQLGNTLDAMKAYNNAIKLDKDFAQAYFNRGMLKVATNKKRGGCEDFQLANGLEYPGAKEALEKYCN
ncbi:MAG TPA: hypothetical protein DEQ87_19305 [Algoriphagus sp.]|jgi:tetratricopeptide (TPR) repeat protein|uniref:tetratricopeptide repeat protein n=1 Tax=Algoriphagus TaxID=246875 RepID=UPI000C44EB0E|nr:MULTISPECIES: tetratricopeptide repeat protein [Algoriphagus]MAL11971.1 hypothetical protein [Algoriphagus sp.]QYH38612.1 tetratricopeptide repeat protein [Algoriphagus sp. NBT04N3]HAD50591.1 hypothetical protein [Algoriphagus sp.]HAH36008.1 hypothetical protein [Algoriphagus sp.]HAS57102.1 hypothetical protein [Algoriphagus sp.]|tara:strand:- start:186 stop:788 length:603 start_codon:yes stop_codon:yes gene_type:complete